MNPQLWNPLSDLAARIAGEGGFVNAHAHFDRAYSVRPTDMEKSRGNVESHLFEKWQLVDKFKTDADESVYYEHISAALRAQAAQGIRACLSFIDCDAVAEDRAMKAAKRAQEYAAKELKMRFVIAVQTLKGVLAHEARDWFEKSLEYANVIGGLPGADKGMEEKHLDVLFDAAKRTGKRVHVHVDQLNSAEEKETELLARKTMDWGLEGKVTAVHGISLAAHKKAYRFEVYKMCVDAGLSFVACPTAWIDSRRNEVNSPTHNAVTPIDEMIPQGIMVAIGSDNICDLYKPFSDGNMFTELRVLLEATHFYDRSELVKIATTNGRSIIGLD